MENIVNSTNFARLIAILLSSVAAYFSVLGLMEIFSSSKDEVMVMAIILEATKVIAAYWSHKYWKILPLLFKGYLVFAIVILMGITTLGIYGFLSKAHIDQKTNISVVYDTQVSEINANIVNKEARIESIDKRISILDSVVDDASKKGYVTKALQLNKQNQKERNSLIDEKTKFQEEILAYKKRIIEVEAKKQKSQTKIGPLKYIVSLWAGDNVSNSILNSAVRILIIILVVVFDPLAIILLISTAYITQRQVPQMNRPPVAIKKPVVTIKKNSNGSKVITK